MQCEGSLSRFCIKPRCRLLAQGCPDPAAPHGSAYWGAPAAHKRTGEVVGAAESDPNRSSALTLNCRDEKPHLEALRRTARGLKSRVDSLPIRSGRRRAAKKIRG